MGYAKFQLSDSEGPIEGFSYDYCIPLENEDVVRSPVRWKNRSLDELKGRSVRPGIRMNMAVLYSITGNFMNHIGYYPAESLGNTVQIDI